jgi:hypothetical protein
MSARNTVVTKQRPRRRSKSHLQTLALSIAAARPSSRFSWRFRQTLGHFAKQRTERTEFFPRMLDRWRRLATLPPVLGGRRSKYFLEVSTEVAWVRDPDLGHDLFHRKRRTGEEALGPAQAGVLDVLFGTTTKAERMSARKVERDTPQAAASDETVSLPRVRLSAITRRTETSLGSAPRFSLAFDHGVHPMAGFMHKSREYE